MESFINASTDKPFYSEGKYENEFTKMSKEMMPQSGDSDTLIGQVITSLNRLSYEYFNNGNCNVADYHITSEEEWGEEVLDEDGEIIEEAEIIREEEGEYSISDFYQAFLDTLRGISSDIDTLVGKVEDFCLEDIYNRSGTESESRMYNLLIDLCMEAILAGKIEDKKMDKRYEALELPF